MRCMTTNDRAAVQVTPYPVYDVADVSFKTWRIMYSSPIFLARSCRLCRQLWRPDQVKRRLKPRRWRKLSALLLAIASPLDISYHCY